MNDGILLKKEWIVPGVIGGEVALMKELETFIKKTNLSETLLEDIRTSLSEAYLNAVEHGNGMDANKPVRIVLWIRASGCDIRVYDEGPGFLLESTGIDPKEKIKQGVPRGWGIHLITQLADEVRTGLECGKFYIEIKFHGR